MAQAAARTTPDQRLAQPTAAALLRVPGLEAGEAPLNVLALEGGTVNQLWRVESRLGHFVLRIDGPQARRPGVDRRREFVLHAKAAAAALAPPIVAGDADQAREYTDRALAAAEDIAEAGDRELLLSDLETIPGQPRYW